MPDERYQPARIEPKWQAVWAREHTWEVDDGDGDGAPRAYVLEMLPYPSGEPHIGHLKNYALGDAIAHFRRRTGHRVLHPMGYDSFGLPAENNAIKTGEPPRVATERSIAAFQRAFRSWGISIDWSREFATHTPEYYRWTQWLFLRFYERGLAYRRSAAVKWCPNDQTVLANEQVIDGRCERCGHEVELRQLEQWFFKITDYADRLLNDLDTIDWPEHVKAMQRNWIGRSTGAEVIFRCAELDTEYPVFTTRPDTLFGATFFVMAPEHPDIARLAAGTPHEEAVRQYVNRALAQSTQTRGAADKPKTGVPLGRTVTNPVTGEEIPMWVADYVLMEYGTGAIMAVPAHDTRDHEFATAHHLPIRRVIANPEDPTDETLPFTGDGPMINSGRFDGSHNRTAYEEMIDWLAAEGRGRRTTSYRLRDWLLSRQRYWGCPIPIIYCADCGAVPVPDAQLPVRLPDDLVPDGRGNPLLKQADFVNVDCPKCGKAARRETDTFDTFVDSSWYYARFTSRDSASAMVDARAAYWLPVDQYIGGVEHAILHLLYARFFQKLMRDLGLPAVDEPFARLLTQGMVLAEGYYRTTEAGGRDWIAPKDVEVTRDAKGAPIGAVHRATGEAVVAVGLGTMSKSKNNGVDPAEMIALHGADTVRLYMMMKAPPEQTLEWNDADIKGASTFLKRLWKLVHEHAAQGDAVALDVATLTAEQKDVRRKLHDTLAKIGDDFERRFSFNTAVAACMELVNTLSRFDDDSAAGRAVMRESLDALLRVLSPIVPHITHALWAVLGNAGAVIDASWPQADTAARVSDQLALVVQVNGKLRGQISVPREADQATIIAAALADENVRKFLGEQVIRKQIVVPGKLVNFVI
jgi:leucyl-tRNA synthetase